jgi:Leucine-rich repeat (LRR) protein
MLNLHKTLDKPDYWGYNNVEGGGENMKKIIISITLIALTAIMIAGCSDETGEIEPNADNQGNAVNEENNNLEKNIDAAIPPEYITIKGERYSTSLTELDLFGASLDDSDIEPLKHMVNLTHLDLRNNQIINISALAGLTNLNYLLIESNQINDISVLAELTNLKTLLLGDNRINDISVLTKLTNLEGLSLYNNPISNISLLSDLTKLTHVSFNDKQTNDEQKEKLKAALPNIEFIIY